MLALRCEQARGKKTPRAREICGPLRAHKINVRAPHVRMARKVVLVRIKHKMLLPTLTCRGVMVLVARIRTNPDQIPLTTTFSPRLKVDTFLLMKWLNPIDKAYFPLVF
jgi:hypothetical protein